ncbi:MAG: phenylalanine--tRNA ligase subunit beta [Candidatus Aenigmatarchaeota archaeon]
MPTIEASFDDLCNLIGKKVSLEEMKKLVWYAKSEIESSEGDLLKIEIKDTNRPELWSVEGIAREIRGRVGKDRGCPNYKVKKSKVIVKVDKKVSKVRPLTVCAVVRKLKIDENVLSQMIQLQEKICTTFGRNRKEVALGIYELDRIKPPIRFTTVKPEGIRFAPLDFEEELTPKEILEKHPKGKEFGHLLKGFEEYPIFIDSRNEVLSLPPIVNSNYSGKVSTKTKNVFIECSGFNFNFLTPALNAIVTALAERKGKVESVKVVYPKETIFTPDLKPKRAEVSLDCINKISGLNLSQKKVCELLEMARYDARLKGNKIEVMYPAYRQDIMNARDIVEDILISYGYDNLQPVYPKIPTVGRADELEKILNCTAEVMVGLGFQEILSYTLTSKENLFKKMDLEESKVVEIENPISSSWSVFRNWLLPSLLEFLSNNKHVEYPQKIFEVGNAVLIDETKETRTKDLKKLACAIADTKASYEDISSVLDSFLSSFGISYKLKQINHKSFIEGRVAAILVEEKQVGVIGEISPSVLENWNLEMPVAAFELELEFFTKDKVHDY